MQHCKDGVIFMYSIREFFLMLASPMLSPMLTKGVPI